MTTRQFLARLRHLNVILSIAGDDLRCNAPRGTLNEALRGELAQRKPEIIAFLRAATASLSTVVPIQPHGKACPIFGVPGHNGDVYCWVRLARCLGREQPFYALEPPGLSGSEPALGHVGELAARYVADVRRLQPHGPYSVCGYCAGGTVAFEMAQQLRRLGEQVAFLGLLEAPFPPATPPPPGWRQFLSQRLAEHAARLKVLSVREGLSYLWAAVLRWLDNFTPGGRIARRERRLESLSLGAVCSYSPQPYPGPLCLILASEESRAAAAERQTDWAQLARVVEVVTGPSGCTGATMLLEPYVQQLAEQLRARLPPASG